MSRPHRTQNLQLSDDAAADDIELETLFPISHSPFEAPEVDLLAIKPPWKRALYELLERPTSSPSAFLIHITTTSLILFSAVVTVTETIPYFHSTSPSVWFGIETSLVALFTVEYVARAVAWSSSWRVFFGWFTSFFGIIDLLAILPYYIEIALQVDTSLIFRFSILRTFRLLRVFRPFRYNNTILLTIEVMYLSFKRSQHALLALGFFVVMFLVIFSTLLYFAERGTWDPILETFVDADGEASQFSSIPAAAWFVLVTITTVGYGEIIPRSFLGRLISVPLLIFGLLLIALPSFVLGREFSSIWEKMGPRSGGIGLGISVAAERVDRDEIANITGTGLHTTTTSQSLTSDSTSLHALQSQITSLQGALDAQSQMLRQLTVLMEKQTHVNGEYGTASLAGRRAYSDERADEGNNRRKQVVYENGSGVYRKSAEEGSSYFRS